MGSLTTEEPLVVFVTGASSGNGRAIAMAFAAGGAQVVCADLTPQNPAGEVPTHKVITASGAARAIFVTLDVGKDSDWRAGVATCLSEFGRIDVLVNNAGILGPQNVLHDMSTKQWDLTLAINLTGPFLGMKHVLPVMMSQPLRGNSRGKVVNIASNGGSYGVPKSPAYTATKAGLIGLTKQAAVDYSRQGININSVSPGIVVTPMSSGFLSDKGIADHFASVTPSNRFGSPSDVANAVLYLASPSADYCHGTDLVVDGGYLCT